MFIVTGKKRKKLLLRDSKDLKAIHDEYYELKVFENMVFDRTYVVERHKYHAKDIMKRYGINSIHELIFLLHRYCGKVVRECDFCGHIVTEVKTRSGADKTSRDDCECTGVCQMCEEPYKDANDDGICYTCKPYYHPEKIFSTEPDAVFFRFMKCIGNTDNIFYISDPEEAKRMMDIAEQYYHWFKNRRDLILEEQERETA